MSIFVFIAYLHNGCFVRHADINLTVATAGWCNTIVQGMS